MDKIFTFIKLVLAYLVKNTALLVGIIEAISKVLAGIASLTPTKKDDDLLPTVDKVAGWIKKALYTVSDKLGGVDPLA
jgi:hypothetical protein